MEREKFRFWSGKAELGGENSFEIRGGGVVVGAISCARWVSLRGGAAWFGVGREWWLVMRAADAAQGSRGGWDPAPRFGLIHATRLDAAEVLAWRRIGHVVSISPSTSRLKAADWWHPDQT